jgi:hypothetical protein
MKQDDVKIGMQARVKIGQRLAEVTVIREIDMGGYKSRRRFECRTADTGRAIKATAARLRPMPPDRLRQMVDRMVTAAVPSNPAADMAAWAASPVGAY